MIKLVNIALSRYTLGESFLPGVHAVPHAEPSRACTAPTQRASIHFAGVVEPSGMDSYQRSEFQADYDIVWHRSHETYCPLPTVSMLTVSTSVNVVLVCNIRSHQTDNTLQRSVRYLCEQKSSCMFTLCSQSASAVHRRVVQ